MNTHCMDSDKPNADMIDKLVFVIMHFDNSVFFAGSDPCCVKKTVGGVLYTLIHEEDTSAYNCQENCVYQKDGEDGKRFCFSEGWLDSVCGE